MSQNAQILEHLQNNECITPLEALRKYGVFRLGARILDLREAGHNIHTEITEQDGPNGKKRFASYKLVKAAKVAV